MPAPSRLQAALPIQLTGHLGEWGVGSKNRWTLGSLERPLAKARVETLLSGRESRQRRSASQVNAASAIAEQVADILLRHNAIASQSSHQLFQPPRRRSHRVAITRVGR
jgi:hypothetical protein